MDPQKAVAALAALAQDTRLAVFRTLAPEGAAGLAAGVVAERLGVAPSTLSFHLAQLERAGLLMSWRVQRRIFYAVDQAGVRALLGFLTEDCCQGRPELCLPARGCNTPVIRGAEVASAARLRRR
jgi:DNA-binding transcriptional ArsR family regulator